MTDQIDNTPAAMRREQMGVRLDPALAARLDAFCRQTYRTRAQVGRWALERLLAEETPAHG